MGRIKYAIALGVLAPLAGAGMAGATPMAAAGRAEPQAGASAAPAAVNMEMAMLAAQVDPPKAGSGVIPAAKDHVLRVERALHARGLLRRSLVDGHYGSSTVAAARRIFLESSR